MKEKFALCIGANLRQFRLAKRLSQAEVAAKLDISQTTYNRIESGKVLINAIQLTKLSALYHVATDRLLEIDGMEKHHQEVSDLKKQLEAYALQNQLLHSKTMEYKQALEKKSKKKKRNR